MSPETETRTEPLTPEEIADREFDPAIRGLDAREVRTFLGEVAASQEALLERITELEAAVEAAEAELEDEGPTGLLVEEMQKATAQVLQAAHDAATELRSDAEREYEEALAAARTEAQRTVDEARAETEQRRDRIIAAANEKRERMLDEARRERDRVRAEVERFESDRDELRAVLRRVISEVSGLAGELVGDDADPLEDGGDLAGGSTEPGDDGPRAARTPATPTAMMLEAAVRDLGFEGGVDEDLVEGRPDRWDSD